MASGASSDVDRGYLGAQKDTFVSRMVDFGSFMYNSADGTVLGRTGRSWGLITLFYLIYYICLAGFWSGMLAIFYQTLDWNSPRLQGTDSLLRSNPALGFRPMPSLESTLIRFVKGDPSTYKPFTDQIQAFMQYYEHEKQDADQTLDCSDITLRHEDQYHIPCAFEIATLGSACTLPLDYGYDDGQPCILLKLNKLFNWFPQAFTNDTVPDDIRDTWDQYTVTIECYGENPADKELVGPIEYYPSNPVGFPFKYFPFQNQQGYRSPIAFIRLANPHQGMLFMIECKAYAKNIYHDRVELAGMTHFEVIID